MDWQDGTVTQEQVVRNDDGTFSVVGSHDYAQSDAIVHSVQLQIDGADGSRVYGSLRAYVNFETITFLESPDQQRALMGDASGNRQYYVWQIFDVNSTDGDDSAYSVTVDWGDGTQSTGKAFADWDGGYYITANHIYDRAGNLQTSLTVTRPPVAGEAVAPIAVESGRVEVLDWTTFTEQDWKDAEEEGLYYAVRTNRWDPDVSMQAPAERLPAITSDPATSVPVAAGVEQRPVFAYTEYRNTFAFDATSRPTVASQIFADKSTFSDREEFSLEL